MSDKTDEQKEEQSGEQTDAPESDEQQAPQESVSANSASEDAVLAYATERLREFNWITLHGTSPDKTSILSFTMEGAHPHDISTVIDRSGVAIRAGHHCAQPLMKRLGVPATARASFAIYNTTEDADRLVEALIKCREFFA